MTMNNCGCMRNIYIYILIFYLNYEVYVSINNFSMCIDEFTHFRIKCCNPCNAIKAFTKEKKTIRFLSYFQKEFAIYGIFKTKCFIFLPFQ